MLKRRKIFIQMDKIQLEVYIERVKDNRVLKNAVKWTYSFWFGKYSGIYTYEEKHWF